MGPKGEKGTRTELFDLEKYEMLNINPRTPIIKNITHFHLRKAERMIPSCWSYYLGHI